MEKLLSCSFDDSKNRAEGIILRRDGTPYPVPDHPPGLKCRMRKHREKNGVVENCLPSGGQNGVGLLHKLYRGGIQVGDLTVAHLVGIL